MVRDELIDAYLKAHYVVRLSTGDLVLRVGEISPRLDTLLSAQAAATAAFITAFNPGSKVLTDAENDTRQAALEAAVTAEGYDWLAGEGRAPDDSWPPEQSLLIPAISQEAAEALALRFGQYAYVWLEAGKPATLVFTIE